MTKLKLSGALYFLAGSVVINKSAGHYPIKIGVLEFCGIKPVKITVFSPVKSADDKSRSRWLQEVETIGRMQK